MINIRTLRAAGLTPEQILKVVEEDQAKVREQSRKRKQKQRSCHAELRDIQILQRNHEARHACHSDSGSLLPSSTINNLKVQEERTEIVALGREFAEFYAAYPHKVGKRAAATAFERARRRVPMAEIMAGLARYANKTDDRPWCNPATWLNQDRCHDQPGPAQEGNGGRTRQGREKRHSISATFDDIFEKLQGGDGASVIPFQANPRLLQNR